MRTHSAAGGFRTKVAAGLVAVVWSGAGVRVATAADVLYLSDYLGVPAGTSAFESNPPFTTVLGTQPQYGFGADCPGNWSGVSIRFLDTGVLAKGIGQHPLESGEKQIDFDLPALQQAAGRRALAFRARLGVDSNGVITNNGGVFTVKVDGSVVATVATGGYLTPSQVIEIDVTGGTTLSLVTTRAGNFNSNHLCWGDAALTLADACPGDFDFSGTVDDADFVLFAQAYDRFDCGTPGMPPGCPADLDQSGVVDDVDFVLFAQAYDLFLCQ